VNAGDVQVFSESNDGGINTISLRRMSSLHSDKLSSASPRSAIESRNLLPDAVFSACAGNEIKLNGG
uniref:hypothetical protein n=1 Tax=Candidatus Electronema sp. TaxID=2698783 RepID=UPI004055DA35